MNDFTKEELQDLHLVYRTFFTDDITQEMLQLTNLETGILNKLQSMIDNYCEHEECQHESNGNVQALLVNPPIYNFTCKKCGRGFR